MNNNYKFEDVFSGDINKIHIEKFYDNNSLCYIINGEVFERFWFLSFISKVDNKKDALNLLKLSDYFYGDLNDEVYNALSDAVQDNIFYSYSKKHKDELYYQEIFRNNYNEILGNGYTLIKDKVQFRKRPDAWLYFSGNEIPVEMKVGDFNMSALLQLNEYMKMYKCDYGIAIGNKLIVDLPDNISFINISEVKKYDK